VLSNQGLRIPISWTRLWKLHGSINWYFGDSYPGKTKTVIRFSGQKPEGCNELMIFPSREKYLESRKLPFITFQDRLRQFLANGEAALFIIGYSFSDEHINEIIFQGLKRNSRLAINALIYGEPAEENPAELRLPEAIVQYGRQHRNLSIYGPDRAIVGGVESVWDKDTNGSNIDTYWSNDRFLLGDFVSFCKYLERFIGLGLRNNVSQAIDQPIPAAGEVQA
jgi:hypothetical protein